MENLPKPEQRKEKTFIVFGENGHENEYVFTMPYAKTEEIPFHIIESLEESLKDKGWEIRNRGSRVEILHSQIFGEQDDKTIMQAIEQALGEQYQVAFIKK